MQLRKNSNGGMSRSRVDVPLRELTRLCARYHIRMLALFGSVLREDFGTDSDVDVLVDFQPGHVPGFRFIDIQEELSKLFGDRRVDLVTQKALHPRIRGQILQEAEVQYAGA